MGKTPKNKEEKSVNELSRYMGMGFQMLAIIVVFTYLGYKLDAYAGTKQPIYAALLSALGVLIALWQMIRLAKKK